MSLLLLIAIVIILITTIGTFVLLSSRAVSNYTDPDGPKFEGSYALEQPAFDGQLTAATWNIAFAEKIDQAIAELQRTDELRQAGVLMLQEMDEAGVERVAKALAYNYVYYPASVHSQHDRNFGNAVLSRWPIVDSAKIILPHENPSNGQIRIATMAIIDVEGRHIPVYSVHTETLWLGPKRRIDQYQALARHAAQMQDQGFDYVIIGGDFNTLTANSLATLTLVLEEVGLERVSQGAGATAARVGVNASLDHIFASNTTPLAAGVLSETEASDHYPVWVLLGLDQLQEDEEPG